MTKLSPATLTRSDQLSLLEAVQDRSREAIFVSLALGTGLRLAEIVGLDVGDVYLPGGQPRVRIRLRAEIAKRRRAIDVFLPDCVVFEDRQTQHLWPDYSPHFTSGGSVVAVHQPTTSPPRPAASFP